MERIVRFSAAEIIHFAEYDTTTEGKATIVGTWGTVFQSIVCRLNKNNISYNIYPDSLNDQGRVTNATHGTGVIGCLMRNESDVSGIPLVPNENKTQHVRFSIPITYHKWVIVSSESLAKRVLNNISAAALTTYSNQVWISLLLCIIFLSVWLKSSLHVLPFREPAGIKSWICCFLDVASVYLRQPLHIPKSVPRRIGWCFWILACFVLSACFFQLLLSRITLPSRPIYVDDIKGTIAYPDVKVFLPKLSSMHEFMELSQDPTTRTVMSRINKEQTFYDLNDVPTIVDTIEKMIRSEAFILVAEIAAYAATEYLGFCDNANVTMHVPDKSVMVQFYAYAYQKNIDPTVERLINEVAYSYMESGLMDRILAIDAWKGSQCLKWINGKRTNERFQPLTLVNLALVPAILSLGWSVALIVFIIELRYAPKKKSKGPDLLKLVNPRYETFT